ncbi:MAG: hypothetical protein ACP5RJ_08450 [Conexivisphaera sp.]
MATYDLQNIGTTVTGTQTVVLVTPPAYSASIRAIRYSNPGAAAAYGQLTAMLGTSAAYIVDQFVVPAGGSLIEEVGDKPIAKLDAEMALIGSVNSGSFVNVTLAVEFVPGRTV